MDAEKLIEEAEIWAGELGGSTRSDCRHYGTLFANLAAALRETAARADAVARERDDLAAANVAANKEIVRLQEEISDHDRLIAMQHERTQYHGTYAFPAAAGWDAAMKTKLRLCAPKPWLRGTVRALVEIWLRRQQAGHQ